ncbi:unnamed protein product, partial [Mesorhabditis belari]|uniref:Uncharacterized protein n=1 Tax=Mesorhabditis belari TaxID=2138241 RepID=A0AAF3FT74_9BILA
MSCLFLLGQTRPNSPQESFQASQSSLSNQPQHFSLYKAHPLHSAESLKDLDHELRETVHRIRLRRYLSALVNEEREKRAEQNDWERMAPIWGR